jgi:hypothetical protein
MGHDLIWDMINEKSNQSILAEPHVPEICVIARRAADSSRHCRRISGTDSTSHRNLGEITSKY